MNLISHPSRFKSGTRVIPLSARHKDGFKTERKVFRIANGGDEFDQAINDLNAISVPGERIYASAGARNVVAAGRIFKTRQVDNEYEEEPVRFYEKLMDRWVSCLMDEKAQAERLWLFDCDQDFDSVVVANDLSQLYQGEVWQYPTKQGRHYIVSPFNMELANAHTKALLHKNPMILWGF